MRISFLLAVCIGTLALPLASCKDAQDTVTAEQSYGASPTLPAPQSSMLPTVNIATAKGWPSGTKPVAANGMAVNAFATGLDHPRTVYVLPNGDVLVAESNAPPKPDDAKGIKGFIMKQVQKWAGAGVPSANRIIAENGIEAETNRAAVLEVDRASGKWRVFASGLRNPNGPSFQPQSGALWVAVNERDELGNDLVPDYMTSVQDGGFYGWPWSYYGQHVDTRVQPQRPDLVARAIVPDYALGAHTASLGLTFNTG